MSFTRRRLVLGVAAVALAITFLFAVTSFKGQAAAPGDTTGATRSGPASAVKDDVRGARLVAVMGQSSLDLRQLNLAPGERLYVDVVVTMGRATVRIPEHWALTTSGLPVIGSIRGDHEQKTASAALGAGALPTGPPPRLILRGIVLMGKVEVSS